MHRSIRPLLLAASCLALATSAFAAEHMVQVVGNSFVPSQLTIAVGDTVTWTNDGEGTHNVVADGLFSSGPPSSDAWSFSFTFHRGGSIDYYCEVHQAAGMTGSIEVEGVFGDSLESGNLEAWDDIVPVRANCACYFSADCVSGTFCDYGPGSFSTEDICTWVDGKPDGVPGAGCNLPHIGEWGGDICDGVCAPSAQGSALGIEDPDLLRQAVELWGDAILGPAEDGGGEIDGQVFGIIEELPLYGAEAPMLLGRQVADFLIEVGGIDIYDHFCHWEQHPGEPDPSLWVDLSASPCRAAVLRLAVDALVAELDAPGGAQRVFDDLPSTCSGWGDWIGDRCSGDDAAKCLAERAADLRVFLTTPSADADRIDLGALWAAGPRR